VRRACGVAPLSSPFLTPLVRHSPSLTRLLALVGDIVGVLWNSCTVVFVLGYRSGVYILYNGALGFTVGHGIAVSSFYRGWDMSWASQLWGVLAGDIMGFPRHIDTCSSGLQENHNRRRLIIWDFWNPTASTKIVYGNLVRNQKSNQYMK
jgi:hypothetical protein